MFHACVAVFRAEPGRISQCLFNGGVFQSVQSVLLVDGGGCGITYLSSNKKNNPHHQQPLKRTHKQKEGVPGKRTHPQALWLLQIKSAFYYLRLTNPKKGLILLAFLSMGI